MGKEMSVRLSTIKENPDNPRVIKDEKFNQLVKSLKDFPDMMKLRPIVVDENNVALGGNMRLKALAQIGHKTIPEEWIKKVKGWTPEQKREFVVKDNLAFGEWNWDELANNWDQEQLTDWGLDIPDFAIPQEIKEAVEDDYEIPDEIQTDIVLGDLFEIGLHRLLCGDCTKEKDVEKLLSGECVELLFTSPPYSDMRTYNGGKNLSVSNLVEFIPAWEPFANYQVINLGIQRKENEVFAYWDDYISKAKQCGYKFLSWNVWDKDFAGGISNQNAMFAIIHEWIFVFGKKPKNLNRTIPNNIETNEKRNRYCKKINGKVQKVVRIADGSFNNTLVTVHDKKQLGTVIFKLPQLARDEFTTKHPAVFPVGVPAEYVEAITNQSDTVADPFIGSGTTMVAAHQLNRKCYGMDLDPKYCQVTIDRMRKLDPSLEIKRNGKVF